MRALTFFLVVIPLAALGGASCKSSDDPAQPPDGITCASVVSVGDGAWAQRILAQAQSGECVVIKGNTQAMPASVTVPPGVIFAGAKGEKTTLTGSGDAPVVTLGERAQLVGIDIATTKGVGIAVRGAKAKVKNVTVTGAGSAAIAVLCAPACTDPPGPPPSEGPRTIELSQVKLAKSQIGLWVSGAHVAWTGGESREHTSMGLSLAAGVIGQEGAQIELNGVTVTQVQGVGILLDGDATTGALKDVQVTENAERGLWFQRLNGTADRPALKIEGVSSFARNRIVGLGGLESRGIIFVGGRVQDTQTSPLVTNLGQTEEIGDGVGLFNSGDVRLDGVELTNNARSAALIDNGTRGIIFVGGRVEGTTKVVVQNTTESVQVDASNLTKLEKALGISAPKLPVSAVLK
jgi:hypothetical protein